MFMNSSKINYVVINYKAWVISLRRFATENDILSLFFWIWIKSHIPLQSPFVYLRKTAI